MAGPRNATLTKAGRLYSWREEKFWSVTTIIGGGVPKPALINWAKKFTAEYAVTNLDTLTNLVGVDHDGAVDWLKNAAFRDRDRKGDIGTAVHDAIEAYSLGKPFPPWSEAIKPRMQAVERFHADFQPEYEDGMTEASVFNRAQHYAGTLDAIATVRGRKLLIDAKTGKGVYPEVALQLAAYRFAEFIGAPDGSEVPMPTVDGCAVLHLTDAGDYQFVDMQANEEVFRTFLYVREVFRWQEELSKRVILGPWPTTLEAVAQPELPVAS